MDKVCEMLRAKKEQELSAVQSRFAAFAAQVDDELLVDFTGPGDVKKDQQLVDASTEEGKKIVQETRDKLLRAIPAEADRNLLSKENPQKTSGCRAATRRY